MMFETVCLSWPVDLWMSPTRFSSFSLPLAASALALGLRADPRDVGLGPRADLGDVDGLLTVGVGLDELPEASHHVGLLAAEQRLDLAGQRLLGVAVVRPRLVLRRDPARQRRLLAV
jgi:hypothetical protein